MALMAGTYRAVPTWPAVLGKARTGTIQVAVQFAIIDPPDHRITWYGYFTEAAFDRTVESLRYCGWTSDNLEDFVEGRPEPEGWGAEVELVCEEEPDLQGLPRMRVRWVNRPGGGPVVGQPLDAAEARMFAASMRAKVRASGGPMPARSNGAAAPAKRSAAAARRTVAGTPPQEHEANQQFTDEDIPF